jgi:hypothetical protein
MLPRIFALARAPENPLLQYVVEFWTPDSPYVREHTQVRKKPLSAAYIRLHHEDVRRHLEPFPGFRDVTLHTLTSGIIRDWYIEIMPKLYRKKTETEKALHAIKLWDMSPVKLQYTFGGVASEWGRILKEQHQPHGVYLAICKEIAVQGDDAFFTWQANKRLGNKTRKGGVVPRTKDVFELYDNFRIEKIVATKMRGCSEDFYDYYMDAMVEMSYEELPRFESPEERHNTERAFLDSLNA